VAVDNGTFSLFSDLTSRTSISSAASGNSHVTRAWRRSYTPDTNPQSTALMTKPDTTSYERDLLLSSPSDRRGSECQRREDCRGKGHTVDRPQDRLRKQTPRL
jgi:hypothetical protein